MNIAVISPNSVNNGVSTLAGLLALEIGARGKKVCLTHTSTKSPSLFQYFGLNDTEEDKTANPARMIKMLKENILKREDVREYCRMVNNTMDIYSANDATFDKNDMLFALDYILKYFPHDFVVVDVDITDPEDEAVKSALKQSDFIILVLEQGVKEVRGFKGGFASLKKYLGNKPMMAVVQKYNPIVGKVSDLALMCGVKELKKSSSWLSLRYNPYIVKYEMNGKLPALHRAMKTNDARIIDISSDVKTIANRIMKFKTAKRNGGLKNTEATEEVKEEAEKTEDKK